MELDEAIKGRRSIRRYQSKNVPKELIRQVIEAATFAPSAKNCQQWRFTILAKQAKKALTDKFRHSLELVSEKIGRGRMGSSFGSCRIMEEAPVVIMVWNTAERGWDTEIHSVAAAIQNLLLKAYSFGLGTLWIGDIFYTYNELVKYFSNPWKMVAAIALGWPAEKPAPRPRLSIDEVAEFLN